jgi:DNA-binding response OmpR family regulator
MPYKIVVADDCTSVQKVIRMAFPDEEFEIYSFEDGNEAIDAIARINPDAVLVSLSLPGKDGYEVGSYMKTHKTLSQSPLILLKGAFERVDKDRLAEVDYEEVIAEPFASELLVQKVRNIIERQNAPLTLPEEPASAEVPVLESELDSSERMIDLIKEEMLEMERELEKRVKARVVTELKEWMRSGKQGTKDE